MKTESFGHVTSMISAMEHPEVMDPMSTLPQLPSPTLLAVGDQVLKNTLESLVLAHQIVATTWVLLKVSTLLLRL